MNELLKQTMACREKAEALRANKKWAEAAKAYEALAKAWIAAAGVATSAAARAERLAESDKALETASKCLAKASKPSSVSGKGGSPKKSPKVQPSKDEEDDDDFSSDDDEEDEDEELPPPESMDKLLSELNSLIGLTGVKRQVQSMVNLLDIQKKREAKGLVNKEQSFHLVFTGNPGTGKTTIARLIAKIYRSMGLLGRGQLVETDRASLVSQYIGETAIKTQNALARAEGGVLFIDEAYALAPEDNGKDFGREAVDTLLKAMEDNRGNLLVIVAGYPDLMDHFINHTNPGLPSRFPTTIFFEDYSADEQRQIFELIARNADYVPTKECIEAVKAHYEKVLAKRPANFANARDVRNLFEKAMRNQANRLNGLEDPSLEQLKTLLPEDLPIQS